MLPTNTLNPTTAGSNPTNGLVPTGTSSAVSKRGLPTGTPAKRSVSQRGLLKDVDLDKWWWVSFGMTAVGGVAYYATL
jgi:Chaperone for protein-folding within the ER, fungal